MIDIKSQIPFPFWRWPKMATRCVIVVEMDGERSAIYRHSDGYPEGVLADIKTFMEIYHDPYGATHGGDYWLANFVFYEKLSSLLDEAGISRPELRWWEYGIGIIDPNDIDNNRYDWVDYTYILRLPEGVITIKEWGKRIFEGKLEEAFERWKVDEEFPAGCHINKVSLAPVLARIMAGELKNGR